MTKTILVVDDDSEVLDMVRIVLQENGFQVITANDAKDAMRSLIVKKPDLIVMDVRMPNMDGLNALDMIRVTQLNGTVPIILWSGESEADIEIKAERLGADDYMNKSAGMPEFVKRIKAQFFRVDRTVLKDILNGVTGDATPPPEDLTSLVPGDWQSFSTQFGQLTLNVLLAPGVEKSAAAAFDDADAAAKVTVFRRQGERWKRIWPKP